VTGRKSFSATLKAARPLTGGVCLFCCCRRCQPLGNDHYKLSTMAYRRRPRVFSPSPRPINCVYAYTPASRQNNVKTIAGRVRGANGVVGRTVGGGSKLPGHIVRTGGFGREDLCAIYTRGVIEYHKSATTTTGDLTWF
jgi:hypothetical protein